MKSARRGSGGCPRQWCNTPGIAARSTRCTLSARERGCSPGTSSGCRRAAVVRTSPFLASVRPCRPKARGSSNGRSKPSQSRGARQCRAAQPWRLSTRSTCRLTRRSSGPPTARRSWCSCRPFVRAVGSAHLCVRHWAKGVFPCAVYRAKTKISAPANARRMLGSFGAIRPVRGTSLPLVTKRSAVLLTAPFATAWVSARLRLSLRQANA